MDTQQIERLVDAAAAELGSDAAASQVQGLAARAAAHWPGTGVAGGSVGIQARLVPPPAAGPNGRDAVADSWDWITRALSALPGDVPCLPVLEGFPELVSGLTGDELLTFAQALDTAVRAAGMPSMRIRWYDALQSGRGDQLVRAALPQLLVRCAHLCGDIRTGDGNTLSREAVDEVLKAAATASRTPVGLTSLPESTPGPTGLFLHAVGRFPDPEHRAAARAWASRMACSARRRSGLPVASAAPIDAFDAPQLDSASPLLAPSASVGRVWI